MATFHEMLQMQWDQDKFVCVGLDSEFGKIPESVYRSGHECAVSVANTIVAFNKAIVEATHDFAVAYKPNFAFYIWHGAEGIAVLQRTIMDIRHIAPNVPVILDCKDMDIGNTNIGYVKMAFDSCQADAITVNPYLGSEAAQSFLDCKDKGIFVLCRTSNLGAGEFQDRFVILTDEDHIHFFGGKQDNKYRERGEFPTFLPLYEYVAYRVSSHWNKNENCGVVVGATYPGELGEVRRIVGDMPILIPGIGTQGGDVEKTIKAGKNSRNQGMIINSSRGIIFASSGPDFADAARSETKKLHDLINQYRNH